MTSHDLLSKSLIKVFFPDFLRLLAPELASRLDPGEATFLDKEGFRVAASEVSGLGKQILVDWIETYVQLSGDDALTFRRLLDQEGNEEVKAMELTWLGQAEARGMERGIEKGSEVATRQAVERMRRMVLQLVEQRFGPAPARVRQKIEAIDGVDPLAALAERILVVPSIADLTLP